MARDGDRSWSLLLVAALCPACWVSFDESLLSRDAGGDRTRRDVAVDGPATGDTRLEGVARDLLAPDLLGRDLPADCKVDGDCDDGLACTTSVCSSGKCVHTRSPGFCLIGGACFASGAKSSGNACLGCDPVKDPAHWINLDGAACDDGVACTHTDKCGGGICQGTPYTCNDGIACTTDSCTGTGPAPAGCTAKVAAGYCLIAGTCQTAGTAPAGTCNICDPAKSTTTWSPVASCVSTVAGDGTAGLANGAALSARFNNPCGLAIGSTGTIYIADELNQRIRSLATGLVATVAGAGTIGALDGAAAQATFSGPYGVAVSSGNVYVADTMNHRIRRIASGQVITFAGTTTGYSDGPVATAQLAEPRGLAVDASGAIYVADSANHSIRKITGGQVSTLAGNGQLGAQDGPAASARFKYPRGLAVDATGQVYVADSENHRIRLISNGQVTTFAGSTPGFIDGAAGSARFNTPHGVALGPGGRIYVADTMNHRIRLIENGQVTTSAGTGTAGLVDGPAGNAQFNEPTGVAVNSSGRVFIADHLNHVIRAYTP